MKAFWLCLGASALLLGAPQQPSKTTLAILPDSVELRSRESRQQLLAEATIDGVQHDLTRDAIWSSSNPKVGTVDAAGLVRPAGDGEATITSKVKGQTAIVKVRVSAATAPFAWNFRKHVIPVFSKMGCNQGACHGALAGKNGFKLTLRGYDPEVDYDTLTRQAVGRRISLAEPAQSLLLLKPTGALPHGGGNRFAPQSLEYRVVSEWIAAGAPAPSNKDTDVVSLEVFPQSARLAP